MTNLIEKFALIPLEAIFVPVRYSFVTFCIISTVSSQLTVATRCGAAGVCVASHVTEELRLTLVHAPIPRQRTTGTTAGDWDQLLNHKDVTHTSAQVSLLAQHISCKIYISCKCT